LAGHNYERYAAGAGMRTTAGMQEVGQRRSSCRGAAGGISDLHGVRTGMNGTSRVSTWMCDAKPFRLAGHNYERYAAGAPVGGIGAAGRDCFGVVQNLDNRAAHPCALCDIPFILNIIAPHNWYVVQNLDNRTAHPCALSRYTVHPEHNRRETRLLQVYLPQFYVLP
jgi:hypothetical protein